MKKEINKTTNMKRKVAWIALAACILLIAVMAGFGSGRVQYTIAQARCGHQPIIASSFNEFQSYDMPGDPLYIPNPSTIYFCTEQQALDAGFHRDALTPAGKAQEYTLGKQLAQSPSVDTAKLGYAVYTTTLNGYTAGGIRTDTMGPSDGYSVQFFFNVKKGGYDYIGIREGKVGSSYQICKPSNGPCPSAGTDASGHAVTKEVLTYFKPPITRYEITIGTTFIDLEGTPSNITDADAIAVFNSLTEYK